MVDFGVATRQSTRSGVGEFWTDEKWNWSPFLYQHLKIKPPVNREPLKRTTSQSTVDQKYHKEFLRNIGKKFSKNKMNTIKFRILRFR